MNAEGLFGRSIVREMYAVVESEYFNLPSQIPAIYFFEEKPSISAAQAGTGSFAAVATWTQSQTYPYPRTYVVPPIVDPEPTRSTTSRRYWEAINYVNQTGQQTQTLLRAFNVERGKALDSVPGTTVADLKEVYPAISNFLNDSKLSDFLLIAEEAMRIDIEKGGIVWENLKRLRKVKLALAYKTISMASFSQFTEYNDKFYIRFKEYEKLYASTLESITLAYDSDGDGEADTETTTKTDYAFIIK